MCSYCSAVCRLLHVSDESEMLDMNSGCTSRNNRMWLFPDIWKPARATMHTVFSYPAPWSAWGFLGILFEMILNSAFLR